MARFLLIGLDGAEPALIERWAGEDRLPNLAALMRKGAFLRARSTTPCATFPAWTTCVTGVGPGRHGVFDFTEVTPGEYRIRFTNATFRRVPALWRILSEAGRRVAVLGVPATYPPEPVNGLMVSGFDSPVATHIDRSFVYPPERFPEVRAWRFAEFQESHIGPDWHARALPLLLRAVDEKAALAGRILEAEPWDFFMAVFGESDTVAHHFWMFHDPESPRHQAGPADAVRQVYERLDAAVGTLVAAAGPGVTVGIVSDHGFGGAGTGVIHLNNWLAEHGYLRMAAGTDSLAKRLALRLVPEQWRGALFRRLRGLAEQAESRSRFAGIDWRHTRAWSEELSYFPSVRVNLAGREREGVVPPEQYDGFVRALCAELEAWDPIARAYPRAELYNGPCVDRAPDIIVEPKLEQEYTQAVLRARGGPPFRRIGPEEVAGGKERGMNGTHRPEATLILSEPCAAAAARLEDVAPTVLAVLGVPAPPMEGRPLLGQAGAAPAWSLPDSERLYTEEEEALIAARLRALGYFE